MSTGTVLMEIAQERQRQLEKWGDQQHPDGTGAWVAFDVEPSPHGQVVMNNVAQQMRQRCQQAAAADRVTWRDITLEDLFEALTETNRAKLRAELIQAAAVCVAWVEDIDRRPA